VLNRILPPDVRLPAAAMAAGAVAEAADDAAFVAALATAAGVGRARVRHVLSQLGEHFADVQSAATREAERRRDLEPLAPLVAAVPLLGVDVHDVERLLELGAMLAAGSAG